MIIRVQLLPQTLIIQSSSSSKPLQNPRPNPKPSKRSKYLGEIASVSSLPQLSHLPNTPISDPGLRFREKLLYLETLNVDPSKALSSNPNLRSTPIASIKSVERCLSSMGIERSALGRILDMHPQLLTCDPYADVYPIFDFLLNEVCIPFPDVRKSIIRCPRLLVCSVDGQLRRTFLFLKDFGFVGAHAITCQTTLLLVSSVEGTLLPKIEYLEGLGFSHKEVVMMVLRSPGLLTFSIQNNFRPKVEYFLKEMKGQLGELKRFPQYFSFSLERKIKPRHRLLVQHGLSLPLSNMLRVSDANFDMQLIELRLQSAYRGKS